MQQASLRIYADENTAAGGIIICCWYSLFLWHRKAYKSLFIMVKNSSENRYSGMRTVALRCVAPFHILALQVTYFGIARTT
jgi:hypothetical protein